MRALIRVAIVAIAILVNLQSIPPAALADCIGSAGTADDAVLAGMTCSDASSADQGSGSDGGATSDAAHAGPRTVYKWATVCLPFDPARGASEALDCAAARSCPDPSERLWDLWSKAPGNAWEPVGSQCLGANETPPGTTRSPQVTPGLVLTELRRIGLPSLQARTQPRDKTLVNFATIFYAEPQTFTRTLTLLGQSVDVEATPTSFTWHYGDGSSATTSTPGAPYPAKDVTHSYTDAHTTVQTSVDVTYSARFRVGNGAWQTIPDTVTIAGPAGALRLSEATAVLSGEYH